MAWQGIPFRVPFDVNEYISVALNSIPKITVESSTDYWGVALTAGAALVGGIIPAWIAKRTFRENAALLKSEREEQQKFLTTERTRQQEFLIEERLEQSKSLEADRQIQVTIAERNFNMQVLSANRQAWISTLRDLISEFSVQAYIKFDCQSNAEIYRSYADSFDPNDISVADKRKSAKEKHAKALDDVEVERRKLELLLNKIELMLNPDEQISKDIILSMYTLRSLGGEFRKGKDFTPLFDELRQQTQLLIKQSQQCFKAEWVRVKQGL
ncbi:hypothetical protein OQ853_06520 [Enterobacter roggenkampii]|uniref:hypothetical protein n=1 Tax=Enterobacter roggenkampii TaxID=1812935 RepID=UPI0009C3AA10|nr:hypothetical protein [Enterobacter roggenkampii]AQT88742.1 hypothetical protein B1H21_09270 [Enterobacter roggenkampii]ASG38006.1 hypothetical protein CES92_03125 [Enterobacter roggenkampii]EMF0891695.1 hypothetical protein [Enterobacter roggenkampii]MDK4549050.1 hypothetical protein [Enterobacter roggenkampii]MDX7036470.1 hypothetical protein [Enterobacter roggenkampii]